MKPKGTSKQSKSRRLNVADNNFDPKNPFGDPQGPPDKPPIDTFQRLILNNIFDTQPAMRVAYMKKLGYELNPRNDNEYRPLGSSSGYAEIDPGVFDELKKGYLVERAKGSNIFKSIAAGTDKAADEMANDFGDLAGTAISGAATAAGARIGSGVGQAGTPLLALATGILGGAGGNAVAEGAKKMIGNVLVDENVPIDKSQLVVQSMLSGLADPVLKGGINMLKSGKAAWFAARQEAIIEALKRSGGGIDDKIIQRAIEEPELFTPEAVKNANVRMKDIFKNLFGLDKPTRLDAPDRIARNGLFGKKIGPDNDLYDAELAILDKNPATKFRAEEIEEPLKKEISSLADLFWRDPEQEAALKALRSDLSSLRDKITVNGNTRDISFKEAREWLTAKQRTYSKFSDGKYEHPAGHILAPVYGEREGVLGLVNKKAASVGSPLPEINARRSKILDTYNAAADNITPSNLVNIYGGAENPKKLLLQDLFIEMDSVLGSKLEKSLTDNTMQRALKPLYENPGKAFGSGPLKAQMLQAGIKGALKGGAAGAGLGAGTSPLTGFAGPAVGFGVGAAAGGTMAANDAARLASPLNAMAALRENSSKLADATADMMAPTMLSPATSMISQEAARESGNTVDKILPDWKENSSSEKPFDPNNPFGDDQ